MASKFFSHFEDEFSEIYYAAFRSEEYVLSDPEASAIFARKALELLIKWAFNKDNNLVKPIKDKIFLLDYIKEESLSLVFGEAFFSRAHKINHTGNKAVHENIKPVSKDDAVLSLSYLVYISGIFYSKYATKNLYSFDELPKFDERLLSIEDKKKFSENDMRSAKLEKENEISKIKVEYNEELGRLKLQFENDILDIEKVKEQDIAKINQRSNQKISVIINEKNKAIENIKNEKLDLLKKFESEKENTDKIIQKLEQKDKEIELLNKDKKEIINKLNIIKDDEINEIKLENDKKIKHLKAENDKHFLFLSNEVLSNKDLINELKEKVSNIESSFIKISEKNKKPVKKKKLAKDIDKTENKNKKLVIDETQGFGASLPKMFSKIDFKLQEAAANVGGIRAQYLLAELYEHGRGCTQSYIEAFKWYSIASYNGSEDAITSKFRVKKYLDNDQIEEVNEKVKIFIKKKNK